ncbi:MAG: pyridoxal 5'-phosphate synthase glutaminase subunit PdxT [Candidatus Eremiobacteraeota bacterium]|nr:pyridoxal 5'-phosphate synthase glutaminase subunit PdxT [Candidatus Eremiobacteraeota bacterium]
MTTAVGVLALQGDVDEHIAALERAGASAFPVKSRDGLEHAHALVIPGGESTTVMKLLERFRLKEPIVDRVGAGMPLWGTCMGMIVAAHDVADSNQPTMDLIDITVRRNAFGRQNESAEVALPIAAVGAPAFPAVFIRAPWIERCGPNVELLAKRDGHGVMVRERNVLATSFHPELTPDRRVHRYFLAMVEQFARRAKGKSFTAA